MIIVRIFVGLSQFTCTCAMLAGAAAASGSRRRPGRRRSGRRRVRRPPRSRASSGRTKSRIDRSCGARSQNTSTSGWTSPRLIRTESTNRMSPSSPAPTSSRILLHRGRVAVGVVAHQDAPLLLGDGQASPPPPRPIPPAASRPARACRRACSGMPSSACVAPASRSPPRGRRIARAPRRGARWRAPA